MKSTDFITEGSALEKHEHGMGMTSYQNDNVMLAGGMRSGNSSAGYTRLKYMVYDLRDVEGPDDFKAREAELMAGFVEVFVNDGSGKIEGLVNIEFPKANRRGGLGRIVIESLIATAGKLKIYDIQRKAISFWNKMGIVYYNGSQFEKPLGKIPRKILDKKARLGLYGIV